jgi:CheY-like chemotaxis protein
LAGNPLGRGDRFVERALPKIPPQLDVARCRPLRFGSIPKSNRLFSPRTTCWKANIAQEKKPIEKPLVVVVDDDESVRESLPDLLREFGFSVLAFASGQEFLGSGSMDRAQCLVLDVAMPGMTGPDIYDEVKKRGRKIPIIFITGLKDDSARKRALGQGAVDVLLKPFNDIALRDALSKAIGRVGRG